MIILGVDPGLTRCGVGVIEPAHTAGFLLFMWTWYVPIRKCRRTYVC